MEFFKPGRHYQVMAKSVETGKFIGIVWRHYEPLPGGIEAKPEREKPPPQPREPQEPRTASEWMKEYAGEIAETLGPLAELLEALRGIDFFSGGQAQSAGSNPQQFPPLDFSGKAPWVLHPYIVREIGEQIKEVSDHIFDRLSGLPVEAAKRMEAATKTSVEEEEEVEEMPLLPNAQEYVEEEEVMEETVPSLTPNKKTTRKRRTKGESKNE
jgi:hypothetical protein